MASYYDSESIHIGERGREGGERERGAEGEGQRSRDGENERSRE